MALNLLKTGDEVTKAPTEIIKRSELESSVTSKILHSLDVIIQKSAVSLTFSGSNVALHMSNKQKDYIIANVTATGITVESNESPSISENVTILAKLPTSLQNLTNNLYAYAFRNDKLFVPLEESMKHVISSVLGLTFLQQSVHVLQDHLIIKYTIKDEYLDKNIVECAYWNFGKNCSYN